MEKMNHEQSEKLIKCNLFIDHQLSWAGDGYFCENCRVRFEPVPNERSEESAEKLLANASPEHIVTVVGMAATEEGSWFTESSYKKAVEYVSDWKEEILQAERTRIIKALEELKENHAHYEYTCLQFDPIIDIAIKAVEKGKPMNTKWEEELNQFYMKNADYEGLSYNQIKAFIKSTLEEVIETIPTEITSTSPDGDEIGIYSADLKAQLRKEFLNE